MRTRVSVVIPNYNKEKTLGACLAAVYEQTYPPAEVILVDDASTDRSREIAGRFPCRLVAFPTNRGVSAARNSGAAASTGEVLFFVDSDIALAPDAVDTALRILREDPDCGVVQGIYDKRPLFDDGPVEVYKTLFEHYWRRRGAGVATATLFSLTALPRAVFDEVGGFDEGMRDAEDIEFGTRLPPAYRIWMSDQVLGRHDEVDRFWPYLWEQFRRAFRYAIALVKGRHAARSEHQPTMRMNMTSPVGLFSCVLGVAALPLAYFSPWLLAVPAILLSVFIVVNRDLMRFVRREKGPVFLGFFVTMHVVLHVAAFTGTGLGVLYALTRERLAR